MPSSVRVSRIPGTRDTRGPENPALKIPRFSRDESPNHNHEHSQDAESTTLTTAAKQHQQATPCVCGSCICAVLLWSLDFFGALFVAAIDDLYFAGVVGGIAILDENIRTVWIQDFCVNSPIIIFPIINLCFFLREHTQACIDISEHRQRHNRAQQHKQQEVTSCACGKSIRGVLLLWLCATYRSTGVHKTNRCVGSDLNLLGKAN